MQEVIALIYIECPHCHAIFSLPVGLEKLPERVRCGECSTVFIPEIARNICERFEINPLETIASGALLLTAPAEDASVICGSLEEEGVGCVEIGFVEKGPSQVLQSTIEGNIPLHRPNRDEIARLFEG